MSRTRVFYCFLCFILFFGALGSLAGDGVVLATQESSSGSFLLPLNQEQPSAEGKLELSCRYPALRDISGASFMFEVELMWRGSESKRFSLDTTVPPKWRVMIVEASAGKEISAIELEPAETYLLYIGFGPLPNELAEPGEYVVTLEASSGDVKETLELTAVVTAQYRFAFYTETERFNTEVTAGQENHLSLMLANTGTAAIKGITFVSSKPYGWTVTFNPEGVDSIEPGLVQGIDVAIKPPRKAIAGDYMITMKAASREAYLPSKDLDIRVTVLTPTIWGWVGIIIVLVVIAGLGVMFRLFGRR